MKVGETREIFIGSGRGCIQPSVGEVGPVVSLYPWSARSI